MNVRHLSARAGETGRSSPSPAIAVPNVTAHPLAASVPITKSPYNGPLLCGFNVPIKGLIVIFKINSYTAAVCR